MTNLSSLLPLAILLVLFSPALSRASVPLDVAINEIAWMGTKISYNDEWIELYNNTDLEINISGWKLVAADGSPQINLFGKIPANGFYLLERTNDDTVPEIIADQIYSGPMGNSGESLLLYDASGSIIDYVDCQAGWFAGDNTSKQTMERKDDGLWQTSRDASGTPKAKNSILAEEAAPPPAIAAQPQITSIPKEVKKDNLTENLAAAGEQIPKAKGTSGIILLTASALAVFSGAAILILKKGLN